MRQRPNHSPAILTELGKLARHLPVLGGALGVVALSLATLSLTNHTVQALLGNGGDVTAVLTRHADTVTTAFVKAMAWGERVLASLAIF